MLLLLTTEHGRVSIRVCVGYTQGSTRCKLLVARMMFIKHNAPTDVCAMCNWSQGGDCRGHNYKIAVSCLQRMEVIVKMINQRTNGPVNAHLIYWPSKAQKHTKPGKYMVKK